MTNIFSDVRRLVLAALDDLVAEGVLPPGLDLDRVAVEPPRDPAHGDLATNAAMVLAGAVRENPMALAERIGAALNGRELVTGDYRGPGFTVAAARPGFLNITLAPEIWHAQLRAILRAGAGFGDSPVGAGERVNVEFVSANPTGPMHVGHGRGAVVGDALAALLAKAGFQVEREYYINDAGAQVDILARSTHLRYREALGEAIGPLPDGYLSRRISDRNRPGARPARRAKMARSAGKRVARSGARLCHRADDGADPRGSGCARRAP